MQCQSGRLGGLRYLYRVGATDDGSRRSADGCCRDRQRQARGNKGDPDTDNTQPLYYVLVKESFYDNLQDYKMWPAGLLLYGGEGVQKTDTTVCRQKAAPPIRQIRGYLDMGEV